VLEAVPTDLFSYNFRLQQQNELVGEVDVSMFRDKARVELQDGSYTLRRERLWSGDYLLEKDDTVIARATKTGVFSCSFDVELPNRTLTLRKLSIWNRRLGVFDCGKQIGSVYPTGTFMRRSNIDLPADWPLIDRIFVFWLAFIVWKRQNSAAA
jgi:hypothetical protein